MSVQCLMQNTTPPSDILEGAPRGTNARYYYAEMFTRLCEDVEVRTFIYRN